MVDPEIREMLDELRGSSEAVISSLDPAPKYRCPACGSRNVVAQTPDEGRPFSCNNCGLEFFKEEINTLGLPPHEPLPVDYHGYLRRRKRDR